ncbi:serine carboxypeptidase-like 2 [Pyrus ussuriensis x Pyrus communis]|uniref:Serine carboxypeptidase-like 2 n=1 Tax=Pyrus ussuriensis x Pyrus communis TaxID=2448454 RepID=A0A5N5GRE0_9ROSA|nr:serine carboxypeptidase-like 2 [Pyrus ussuriensis x Pyrus communis]
MIIPVLAEGYLLGNPLTDTNSDDNARVTYAHRQALIPDELYKSAKKNCSGQYRGINQSNKQCAKDLQVITMLTEKINHECILEPQCRPISGAYGKMADHQKALLERLEESHIKLNSMQTSLNPKFQGLGFAKFGCRFYENLLLHVWANDVNVQKALRVHKVSEC